MKKILFLCVLISTIFIVCSCDNQKVITHFAGGLASYPYPEPGQIIYKNSVPKAREYYKNKDVKFLVNCAFTDDGGVPGPITPLTPEETEKEYLRFLSEGYAVYKNTMWSYKNQGEKYYYDVLFLLLSEDELANFKINENYGYSFDFFYNGDHSPIDFDMCKKAELSDLKSVSQQGIIIEKEDDTVEIVNENYSRYTDGVFNFTVAYPVTWASECSAYYEGDETRNASPDSGICIYVKGNKEDYMYVYGQHGTIGLLNGNTFEKQHIKNNSGKSGTLYINEVDGKTNGQLLMEDNKHISVVFSMNSNVFLENNEEIMNILHSIEY